MKRFAPVIVALLIVAGAGMLHALWTDRWGVSPKRSAAVSALETIPTTLGAWDGRSLTMSARELEITEADGCVSREYVNRSTGGLISLLIVCGRPGPVSVHPPEVCYQGAGYSQTSATVPFTLKGEAPADFRVIDFVKGEPGGQQQLRVFYTWGKEGRWSAPERPRLTYALTLDRDPVLFKMYVIRPKTGEPVPVDQDPAVDFIRLLLPALQKSLFALE